MSSDVKDILLNALQKYGEKENICFSSDLKGNWQKFATFDSINISFAADIDLRHKLISNGRILEENTDMHYYCWLIQLKGMFAPEVLVVTIRDEYEVQIGAYAKEGLLSKGTSAKAIAQVKDALSK